MIAGLPPALAGADRAGLSSGVAATGTEPGAAAAAPFGDMFVALLGVDTSALPGTPLGTVLGSVPGTLSPTERAGRGQGQAGAPIADASPAGQDEHQAGAAIAAALAAFLTTGALPAPIARREAAAAGDVTEGDTREGARRLGAWAGSDSTGTQTASPAPGASMQTSPMDGSFGASVAAAQGQAPAPPADRALPEGAPLVGVALPMAASAPPDPGDVPTPRQARSTTATAPRAGTGEVVQEAADTASPVRERTAGVASEVPGSPSRPDSSSMAPAIPPTSPTDGPRAIAAATSPVRGERQAIDAGSAAPTAPGQAVDAVSVPDTNADQQPGGHPGGSRRRAGSEPAVGQLRRPVPTGMPQGGEPVVGSARPTPQAQEFHAADVAVHAVAAASSGTPGTPSAPPAERPALVADRSAAPSMGVLAAPPTGAPMAIELEHPQLAEAPVRGRALDDVLPTQIVQSLRMQWAAGTSEATVQLRPEYLGALTVSIKVEQGAVVATLHAESADVRRWIDANTATLRDALAEHGLRLERVVVREPAGQAEDRGSDRREGERPPQRRAPSDQRRRRPDESAPTFDLEP